MERVGHDGRETAYRVARGDGTGPTTLYVHGSGSDHRIWGGQYAPRGPVHPAAALDLSGHGDSDAAETEPGPETLAAYAGDTVAVAREVGADVLVGHSLGGAVVLEVVLETAFEPSGIVLADTGAKLGIDETILRLLDEDFEGLVEMLHGNSRLARAETGGDEQPRAALLAAGQRVTRRDFLTCNEFDVRDRLDEVEAPALAVVGDHDALTPPEYHEFLAENLPDCELTVLEDATHLSMLEQPAAFDAAVRSLVERVR